MASPKNQKLPYFSAYLDALSATRLRPAVLIPVVGTIGVGAAFIVLGSLLMRSPSPVEFLIWAAISFPLIALSARFFGRYSRPKSEADRHRERTRLASRSYLASLQRRKLHKELDITAQQILEAASFYHAKIVMLLTGPQWVGPSATTRYPGMRDQIMLAAEESMGDLVILCEPCIGKPEQTPKEGWENLMTDLSNLDFDDAFGNFKDLIKGGGSKSVHRSPYLPAIFDPARTLAEKLQSLSLEVEKLTGSLASGGVGTPLETGSPAMIDQVLGDLRARHLAESELEQRLHIGE